MLAFSLDLNILLSSAYHHLELLPLVVSQYLPVPVPCHRSLSLSLSLSVFRHLSLFPMRKSPRLSYPLPPYHSRLGLDGSSHNIDMRINRALLSRSCVTSNFISLAICPDCR